MRRWASSSRHAARFCDPAGTGVQSQTGESEFDIFKLKGLAPVGTKSSIRDGGVRIADAIADPDLPLLVSSHLTWLTEALGAVAPDRRRPDVYDESSTYTHCLDALRYFFVNQSVGQGVWISPNWVDMPDARSRF